MTTNKISDDKNGDLLKLAQEVVVRDDADNAGDSRILRPGLTDEYKLAKAVLLYAEALQEAASIGIANLVAYVGAYSSLNAHKRRTWDRLNELHAMCDKLPEGTIAVSAGLPINEERVRRIAGAYFGDPRHVEFCVGAINKALRESHLLISSPEAPIIKGGVEFIIGPGGDEGTRAGRHPDSPYAPSNGGTGTSLVGQVHYAMANDGKCGPVMWFTSPGSLPDGTKLYAGVVPSSKPLGTLAETNHRAHYEATWHNHYAIHVPKLFAAIEHLKLPDWHPVSKAVAALNAAPSATPSRKDG